MYSERVCSIFHKFFKFLKILYLESILYIAHSFYSTEHIKKFKSRLSIKIRFPQRSIRRNSIVEICENDYFWYIDAL